MRLGDDVSDLCCLSFVDDIFDGRLPFFFKQILRLSPMMMKIKSYDKHL